MRAANSAAPIAPSAAGMAGLIDKSSAAKIHAVPSDIAKAVITDPIISLAKTDFIPIFSTSCSTVIICVPSLGAVPVAGNSSNETAPDPSLRS